MNAKLFSIICALSMVASANWDYVMPIVLTPLLEFAKSSENLSQEELQELYRPRLCALHKIVIDISENRPTGADGQRFDMMRSISFDKPGYTCLLFMKDGLVREVHTAKEGGRINEKVAIGTWDSLGKICPGGVEYTKRSRDIMMSVLREEAFVASLLKPGRHEATLHLQMTRDSYAGKLMFEGDGKLYMFFFFSDPGMSKLRLGNFALSRTAKCTGIKFNFEEMKDCIINITTYGSGAVHHAVLFRNDKDNGFHCNFHKNGGLRFYGGKADGRFGSVTLWRENGTDSKNFDYVWWLKNGMPGELGPLPEEW